MEGWRGVPLWGLGGPSKCVSALYGRWWEPRPRRWPSTQPPATETAPVSAEHSATSSEPAVIGKPGTKGPTLRSARRPAVHSDLDPPRAARDLRRAGLKTAPRPRRSTLRRSDFGHLSPARLDDKLMINDLQASPGEPELTCDLRVWWAVQDLNL
jgi:hypothetical protein